MTRKEFLSQLQEALQDELDTSAVRENVNYYDDYIVSEIQKGKTEDEVLMSLGEPWILAKTIVQAQGGTRRESVQEAPEWNSGGHSGNTRVRYSILDTWWKKLLLVLSIVLVIAIIVIVITGLIRLLAPIIIPLIIILIIFRLIRGGCSSR